MPADPFYTTRAWQRIRNIVIKRDGPTCYWCHKDGLKGMDLHVDHLIPRSVDPTLELSADNCVVSCATCNTRRRNDPLTRLSFANPNWIRL